MNFEIFQQGPEVYVPYLLLNLAVTLLEYGTIPMVFALVRNKGIGKGKYWVICAALNLVVMVALAFLTSTVPNGAPYCLWTGIFCSIGSKILDKKGILY